MIFSEFLLGCFFRQRNGIIGALIRHLARSFDFGSYLRGGLGGLLSEQSRRSQPCKVGLQHDARCNPLLIVNSMCKAILKSTGPRPEK